VSAKDKATSKQQNITITASSGLSEAEIQKMVKDAQEHESEDKKKRETIEARNQLETLAFSVQKHFDENKEKIPEAERAELDAALKEAKDTVETKRDAEAAVFKSAFERLQKASHKMAEALYRAAGGAEGAQTGGGGPAPGAGQPPGAGKDEDVIDAEYTESPKA
jgi:molecular chaperone DnaK